jgi:hypothetical protein
MSGKSPRAIETEFNQISNISWLLGVEEKGMEMGSSIYMQHVAFQWSRERVVSAMNADPGGHCEEVHRAHSRQVATRLLQNDHHVSN